MTGDVDATMQPAGRLRARLRAVLCGLLATATALALSVPAPAAECNGDECQGPPPAPEEVTPGTAVVEGPPNPPVRFPKPHHKKPHHKKPHRKKKHGRHRGGR